MRPSSLTSGAIAATSAGLLLGGAAYAALYPPSQIFGPVLVSAPHPTQLALTYDDGPNPALTPRLLNLLEKHAVRATFFLIGSFARQQPGLTRDLVAAGHLLGNHTLTHPRLTLLPTSRIRHELATTQQILEDLTGTPVRHFRPPHGARRPAVLEIARELGMTTVQWNVTGQDWKPIGVPAILANIQAGILRHQRRGRSSNILLHDGGHQRLGVNRLPTLEVTARLLQLYPAGNFVTVDAWPPPQP